MVDLLTAWRMSLVLWCRSVGEGRITLTLTPVSTRKWVPEAKSWTKKRQLDDRLGLFVATSDWPTRFLTWNKVADTCKYYHRIESGSRMSREVGKGWKCRSWWWNGISGG